MSAPRCRREPGPARRLGPQLRRPPVGTAVRMAVAAGDAPLPRAVGRGVDAGARPGRRRRADDGRRTSRSSPTRSTPPTSSPRRARDRHGAIAYVGSPRTYKGFDLLPDRRGVRRRSTPTGWCSPTRPTTIWSHVATAARDGRRRRVSLEGKFPDVRDGVRPVRHRRVSLGARVVLPRRRGGDAERDSRRRQRPRADPRRCSATTRRGCCSRSATRAAAAAIARLVE